jgi:excinuclease ABC subunit C
VLELDCGLDFAPENDGEFFSAVPPLPAVCLIALKEEKAEPLLIRTANLQRRVARLLGPPDAAGKRLNLRGHAKGIRYRLTGSRFEQALVYYVRAREIFPGRYRALLRMRPPAVLKVNLRNAYPRCYVTRRIPADAAGASAAGIYYGPFPSRKSAEGFAEKVLDFFKVRRCQIKIRRDPSFPGCIYSEMKMCLAPCFAGCSKEEYDSEVGRLVQFLETNGDSLRAAYENEREQASELLEFERASALHKKVEKIDDVLRGKPEIARGIQDLDAVILQRTSAEQVLGVYAVHGGRLAQPLFVNFAEIASQPRSLEQLLRQHMEDSMTQLLDGELADHLWLVARWFYSNPREGEMLFRDKDWPYRRIMRACARLLAPPAAENSGDSGDATKNSKGDQ